MTHNEYGKWWEFCRDRYDEKTFRHAQGLIDYLTNDLRVLLMMPEQELNCMAVALGHDLLEDTYTVLEDIEEYVPEEVVDAIMILSRDDNMSYPDYIKDVVDNGNTYALIVKQADMYDHMSRTSTLTPRLRAKYEPVIPKLIGLEDFYEPKSSRSR